MKLKPTALLHVCCAPCSPFLVETLRSKFALTLLFYNPHIFEQEEYLARMEEVRKFAGQWRVEFLESSWEAKKFRQIIRHLEDPSFRDYHCEIALRLSLNKAACLAKQMKFDFFATTLSMSPGHSVALINQVGNLYAKSYEIGFLDREFRRFGGEELNAQLIQKYQFAYSHPCRCAQPSVAEEPQPVPQPVPPFGFATQPAQP